MCGLYPGSRQRPSPLSSWASHQLLNSKYFVLKRWGRATPASQWWQSVGLLAKTLMHPGPGSPQGTDASVFAGLMALIPSAIPPGWHGTVQFMCSGVASDLWGLRSTAQRSQAKSSVSIRHPATKALFWGLLV